MLATVLHCVASYCAGLCSSKVTTGHRLTNKGVVALPVRPERRRDGDKKPLAASEVKNRLQLWLESDEGREWKHDRDRRVKECFDTVDF
jgi:hypothetical protein